MEHTLRGDRLAAADPDYLDTVVRGLRLMLGAVLLCLAGFGLFVAALFVGRLVGLSSDVAWGVCAVLCLAAAGVVWPRAVRLFTTPEEPRRAPARHEAVRRWTRAAGRLQAPAVALLALLSLLQLLPGAGGRWGAVAAPFAPIGAVIVLGTGVLLAIQVVTVPWHIRQLASRIPSRRLMTSARTSVIVGGLVLTGAVNELLIPPGIPVLPRVLEVASGLGLIVLPFAFAILFAQAELEIDRVRSRRPDPPTPQGPS